MRKYSERRSMPGLAFALGAALAFGLSTVIPASAVDLALSSSQPTIAGEAAGPTEMAAIKPSGGDSGPGIYIVRLIDPAVATYRGGIPGYKATSRAVTGERKLNTKSKAARAYAGYLKAKQDAFITDCENSLGHSIDIKFTYQHALNGVAMELSAGEAEIIAELPEVASIAKERFEVPLTDAGPAWIGAPSIWDGPPFNVPHSMGEGVVVGILDTGINHAHPSYADIGGDGFDHTNPLGSGNFVPGSYCDLTDPSFCNDKLIGAWSFVPADSNFPAPEDSDGHGSHTSSTAAGNVLPGATIFGHTTSLTRDISGVAPHANLIMYDVCVVTCPGSALVAAVNQVIVDSGNLPNGIAAINYSISGGSNPYNNAVELGFLAATEAGVLVSASAGNTGPGPDTVNHRGPWTTTVAAMTHNRVVRNSLVDLNSDGPSLADIVSVGFTSGFGPAAIVHAEDFPTSNGSPNDTNPAQCLAPFPAGTFNGEIVVCDRGTIARVAKGANVLAGGAGGFVLANTAAQGESVVGDNHFLPAVHIGFTDAEIVRNWLNTETNTMASITGFFLDLDPINGDVTAGFSSRGPTDINVIKPDVGAPGVGIFAAEAAGQAPAPEFQFLSGTSMSAPHDTGAAALISAVRPDWTPHMIKSALMMTANNVSTLKEDGMTPTDHFDVGGGRIDLTRVTEADLVLDETTANFLAADPALGGDPGTLNIASMQNGNCVGSCSWTRTLSNTAVHTVRTDLSVSGPAGLSTTVSPETLKIKAGKTGEVTVTADTTFADPGWNFADLNLQRDGDGPDLHMPIAAFAANSTDANLLTKLVDQATIGPGDVLTYTIGITNGPLTNSITITDTVPIDTTFVSGSETEVVTNGTTISPFSFNPATNSLTWTGTLDPGGLFVGPSPAPFGFIPLPALGVPPFPLPSNPDDGGFIISGIPAFDYSGQTHNSVIWSVNGTIEPGAASGFAASATNTALPNPSLIDNTVAPWWTDLNLGAGGNWYAAILTAGPRVFTVFEWEDVPRFGNLAETASFQIWIEGGTPDIWFVYDQVQGVDGTVGVENDDGTIGDTFYFDGTGTFPVPGTELQVTEPVGGTATFGFQVVVDECAGDGISNEVQLSSGGQTERAIAASRCE